MSHGTSHGCRRHGATATRALSKNLRRQDDLSDWASSQTRATGLATGPLERAAIAATITASEWQGRRSLARQTSNQKHSETPLARKTRNGKPWNLKDSLGGLDIRRAGISPAQGLKEVKDFCSHRRLYLQLNKFKSSKPITTLLSFLLSSGSGSDPLVTPCIYHLFISYTNILC